MTEFPILARNVPITIFRTIHAAPEAMIVAHLPYRSSIMYNTARRRVVTPFFCKTVVVIDGFAIIGTDGLQSLNGGHAQESTASDRANVGGITDLVIGRIDNTIPTAWFGYACRFIERAIDLAGEVAGGIVSRLHIRACLKQHIRFVAELVAAIHDPVTAINAATRHDLAILITGKRSRSTRTKIGLARHAIHIFGVTFLTRINLAVAARQFASGGIHDAGSAFQITAGIQLGIVILAKGDAVSE